MRWLPFILLCVSGLIEGQNPFHLTIDKASGLPSNTVYDIFQDSKGFMWFATNKGLCRFDGDFIKTYTATFQTSKAGSYIKEDSYGRVWYENFDGFLYYVQGDILKNFKQTSFVSDNRYFFTAKHLFLIHEHDLLIYDLKTLQYLKTIPIPIDDVVASYLKDNKLYCIGERMVIFNEDFSITQKPIPDFNLKSLNPVMVSQNEHGVLLSSKFSNKHYTLNAKGFTKLYLDIPANFIQNVSATPNNNWFCTAQGVYKRNNLTGLITSFFTEYNISSVFKDKSGNHWISTINNGVFFINRFNSGITPLPAVAQTLAVQNDDLLIGLQDGRVLRYDTTTKSYNTAHPSSDGHAITQLFALPYAQNWYATSSKFKAFGSNNHVIEITNAVKEICAIDQTYCGYAATNGSGLFRISNKPSPWDGLFDKHRFEGFTTMDFSKPINDSNGKSVAYNSLNKKLYVATNVGLRCLTFDKIEAVTFLNGEVYISKLNFYEDVLYGFTNNNELLEIRPDNQVKKIVLPSDLSDLIIDKASFQGSFLYLYTSKAVFEIHLKTLEVKRVVSLTSDIEILDLKKINNCYYLASSKGLITIPPITSIQETGSNVLIANVSVNGHFKKACKKLTLAHNENDITINYVVLSPLPNERKSLIYSVNNGSWKPLPFPNRAITFSSLSPGTYNVEVKIEQDSLSNTKVLEIVIEKPWWQHLAFLSLLFAAIIGIAFLLVKRKIHKTRLINKNKLEKVTLEKNLIQSRLKALRSQMNPHFFYNALNTLQSFILANEKKEAITYLNKFSSLTRTMLDMSERDSITVNEEIAALTNYLEIEKVRFDNTFKYTITVQNHINGNLIKIPTMLLQPYVENAIKHGLLHKQSEKRLSIQISKIASSMQIIIEDNGVGREKSMLLNATRDKNHTSFATKALEDRVHLMNKETNKGISIDFIDLKSDSGEPLGTSVVIIIKSIF